MWEPIKLKGNSESKPGPGWYCFDNVSQAADPRRRSSGKQSAQKECDRRNRKASEEAVDGKTRNAKTWFTIGYVNDRSELVSDSFQNNPIHYHGYMNELLHQTVEIMVGGYIQGAVVAVIWPGQLSRQVAIYGPNAIPVHHVFADGHITGSTA
jgi:hypothetical protein